jgi:hypothetical protein
MREDSWVKRMVTVMCEEVPVTKENLAMHGRIALAASNRCQGLDHRKVGLFAADALRIAATHEPPTALLVQDEPAQEQGQS